MHPLYVRSCLGDFAALRFYFPDATNRSRYTVGGGSLTLVLRGNITGSINAECRKQRFHEKRKTRHHNVQGARIASRGDEGDSQQVRVHSGGSGRGPGKRLSPVQGDRRNNAPSKASLGSLRESSSFRRVQDLQCYSRCLRPYPRRIASRPRRRLMIIGHRNGQRMNHKTQRLK